MILQAIILAIGMKKMTKNNPTTVYLLMEEVDPIGVYHHKLDAQNDAIKYELHNYTITELELV